MDLSIAWIAFYIVFSRLVIRTFFAGTNESKEMFIVSRPASM